MSIKKYRLIDFTILTGLYLIFEYIIYKASTVWFSEQAFTLSLFLSFFLLLLYRWDLYSIIFSIIGGLFFSIIYGGTVNQILIYTIGNLGALSSYIIVKIVGKDKIKENFLYTLLYVVVAYIMLEVFRGILGAILEKVSILLVVEFLTKDILSLVFAILIVFIARKQNGLFEDQKHYLKRIREEEDKKRNIYINQEIEEETQNEHE